MKHIATTLLLALALPVYAGTHEPIRTQSIADHTRTYVKSIHASFVLPVVSQTELLGDDALLSKQGRPKSVDTRNASELLQQSGIRFTENRGQIVDTRGRVRNDIAYVANASGARLYFRNNGISYIFTKNPVSPCGEMPEGQRGDNFSPSMGETERGFAATNSGSVIHLPLEGIEKPLSLPREETELGFESYRLDMTLVGSNPFTRIRAEGELPGYVNYYLPHCPNGITGVKEYSLIVYENVYDNIDLELFSSNGKMKYNFVVRPGGDVSNIKMKYDGATETALMKDGALTVATPLGRIEEATPYTYSGEESYEVSSRFLRNGNIVSFAVDDYDQAQTLVIDPWATYYGGSSDDAAVGIATDTNGNVVITGQTSSTNFPVQGAQQGSYGGGAYDAFAVMFNNAGVLQWATYYGGSLIESATGVAMDGNGNVVMSGVTNSSDFPVQNPQQGSLAGTSDAFIVKLNNSGMLQWATYYGGTSFDRANGITCDGNGNAIIAGYTSSINFPVQNPVQGSHAGGPNDAFITQFNSSGVLQWATYFGGSGNDLANGVDTDGSGNVLICGRTNSTNFPVQNAHQGSYGGGLNDAFIAKLNNSGAVLMWSTYYGGSDDDISYGIATDGNGNVVISGTTKSTNFPVQNAHQSLHAGGTNDAFIVYFNSNGTRQWATYFGGSASDYADGVATDSIGNVIICGRTNSTNFPIQNPQQGSSGGGNDAFASKFNSNGVLQWATYYGGSASDYADGVASDNNGNVAFCGYTYSSNFPVMNAHQGSIAGNSNAFVVHLDPSGLPVELISFTGEIQQPYVHLIWVTASESNNAGFELQRVSKTSSQELLESWNSIAFIPGNGNTSGTHRYDYLDPLTNDHLIEPDFYYRLKQIDFDGSFQYSPVVEVLHGSTLDSPILFTAYPQPASESAIIHFTLREADMVSLSLHDVLGRTITQFQSAIWYGAGEHAVKLHWIAIPPGIYLLKLQSSHATASQRIAIR